MQIKRRKAGQYFWLIIGFVFLMMVMLFVPTAVNKKKKEEKKAIKSEPKIKDLQTNRSLKDSITQSIEIEISAAAYYKLKTKRDKAISEGFLITEEDDYVDATLHFKNKPYPAKIRLKGDYVEHLSGETWSFRVKIKDGYSIMGMRKFSLQHPRTRNYYGDWLFHKTLKDHGVLSLRYDFLNVNLKINKVEGSKSNKEFGLFAIEESFDKPLIEFNGRREGLILKIDEDPLWEERRALVKNSIPTQLATFLSDNKYQDLNILPFGEGKVLDDPNLKMQFDKARVMMEAFVDGDKPVSEIYDIELLATYNAICNVLGGNHSMILHNVRAYYNPINSRLEPVGFDSNVPLPHYFRLHFPNTKYDIEYNRAYAAALEKFSNKEYFDKLINKPDLQEVRDKLKAAYPNSESAWKPELFEKNRKFVRISLFPAKMLNIFYVDQSQSEIKLNIENYGRFPVEIEGIKLADGRVLGAPIQKTVVLHDRKETVSFRVNKDFQRLFVSKKQGKIKFNVGQDIPKFRVIYKTIGTSKVREEKILPWTTADKNILDSKVFDRKVDLSKWSWLHVDEKNKVITCEPQLNLLREDIVIPKGYTFKILPGTAIDFTNENSRIVSFSPVQF